MDATKEISTTEKPPRRRRRRAGKATRGKEALPFATEERPPGLLEEPDPHLASASVCVINHTTPEAIHLIPRSLLDDSPVQSPQL